MFVGYVTVYVCVSVLSTCRWPISSHRKVSRFQRHVCIVETLGSMDESNKSAKAGKHTKNGMWETSTKGRGRGTDDVCEKESEGSFLREDPRENSSRKPRRMFKIAVIRIPINAIRKSRKNLQDVFNFNSS